jgi:HAD superfamily phosphoserine phosphatase-like hydrolase
MIVLCDFDGTITNYDTLDYIIQTHYGEVYQKQLEKNVNNGKINHDIQLRNLLNDMGYSINDIINKLSERFDKSNDLIDKSFVDFYNTCKQSNLEFYIISSGFKQIIQKYLPFIAVENIISNEFDKFLNGLSIDKLSIVEQLSNNKKYIYIGDGPSDFNVINANKNRVIYAKKNSSFDTLCITKKIKHHVFSNFNDIKILNHLKLLSPGVVKMNNRVLDKLSVQHSFMHRHQEFHTLYDTVSFKLKNLCTNKESDYTTLLVTGSGTTSMDEVINAFVDNAKDLTKLNNSNILILSNGMFGERWIEIASFYNNNNENVLYTIKKDWGYPFDLGEIKNSIIRNKIDTVIVVHCDTSVGILNNIHDIGCLINELKIDKNINFIVDAVSTFGAIPINMCNSYIDILVTNPNKALASSMGVGIIIGRNITLNNLKESNYSYSLNLKRHYEYALKKETCNTCSISCINALNYSLNMSFKTNTDVIKYYNNYKLLYNILYTGIKHPKLLGYDISTPCIITILYKESSKIIQYLFDNGFVVYECKGHLFNKGFQISLYGYDGNIKNVINIVKLINEFV